MNMVQPTDKFKRFLPPGGQPQYPPNPDRGGMLPPQQGVGPISLDPREQGGFQQAQGGLGGFAQQAQGVFQQAQAQRQFPPGQLPAPGERQNPNKFPPPQNPAVDGQQPPPQGQPMPQGQPAQGGAQNQAQAFMQMAMAQGIPPQLVAQFLAQKVGMQRK